MNRGKFLLPPGDDAAVLKQSTQPVLSIDGLAEGTHFRSSWERKLQKDFGMTLGRALGWKLLGSSLSDLAATGETWRRWAMIFLGAPPSRRVGFAMDLFEGLRQAARRYACVLAGGDTVKALALSLVSAVGAELKGRALTRSGARPGDLIGVCGTIGDASVGLCVLDGRLRFPKTEAAYFVRRFFDHRPLLSEGAILAKEPGVTAAMDLSDALTESLNLLSAASQVGTTVELEQIPVSRPYYERFKRLPALLTGGEDYALLFTIRPDAVSRLRRRLRFSLIGRVVPKAGVRTYSWRGRSITPSRSFEQF